MLLSITSRSRLTATFITITNLYLAFALPATEPKGDIVVRESLAIAVYIPIDQKCDQREQWYGRHCFNVAGLDNEWFDTCLVDPATNGFETKAGSCQPDEMCVPIRVRDVDDTRDKDSINCMRRPTKPKETAPNRQSGVVTVINTISGAQQHIVSVDITTNLPEASVSAVLEGRYH